MYTSLLIQLIAASIKQGTIPRQTYNEDIHPLVQALFKTKDTEHTCQIAWSHIVDKNNDIETGLLFALKEEQLCQ